MGKDAYGACFTLTWQRLSPHPTARPSASPERAHPDRTSNDFGEGDTTRKREAIDIDGVLTDELFSYEGNLFSSYYYEERKCLYISDFCSTFPARDVYQVEETWENFDSLNAVITNRYDEWGVAGKPTKPYEKGIIQRLFGKIL